MNDSRLAREIMHISPSDKQSRETTRVIICGGGPTGVMLSALLGQLGVPNIVLEREQEIATDPRGIALDEDGIRCIQAIGMYDRIYSRIGHSTWRIPRDHRTF